MEQRDLDMLAIAVAENVTLRRVVQRLLIAGQAFLQQPFSKTAASALRVAHGAAALDVQMLDQARVQTSAVAAPPPASPTS